MPGRVVIPIRKRARNRGDHKLRDENLNRMTHGVMVICLGFLLLMSGTLMIIFGSENVREDELEPMLVAGPLVLVVGLVCGITGGIVYSIYFRRKNRHNGAGAEDEEDKEEDNVALQERAVSDSP